MLLAIRNAVTFEWLKGPTRLLCSDQSLVKQNDIIRVFLDLSGSTSEGPTRHGEIASTIVYLDLPVVDAHSSHVCRQITLCPNLQTLAARRNLDVCIAETLDDPLRPRLERAVYIKTLVQVDANEGIVAAEHEAESGIPLRMPVPGIKCFWKLNLVARIR